jgi:hypothetical protein
MSNKPRDCYYMAFPTDSDANPPSVFFFKSAHDAKDYAIKRSFDDRTTWSVCKYEQVMRVVPKMPSVEYTIPDRAAVQEGKR